MSQLFINNACKNLKDREEVFLDVHEKALEGTAKKDKLRKMEKVLSDEVNINLIH
ncbi:hypothetical protein QNH20_15205 [Neobacillus sp. WH10]|uniref:hypothetical protein n=1 Tax=Neobacillus sp. WH10 TaxID=3047873 RepID=UPI0024C0FCB2|nr:hypothetical protein [Neobacillus sp. WH10]WHY75489.1 hypothetical protein QNH20_15205 [Neobacillus sp. WH10]